MKILLIENYYYPYISGVTESTKLLAENIAKTKDFEVAVLCSNHDNLPKEEIINKVKVYRAPIVMKISKGTVSPAYIMMAKKLAKEYDEWIMESTKPLYDPDNSFKDQLSLKAKYYADEVAKIRTTNPVTINRLIEYSLGLNLHDNYKASAYRVANKYGLKIMNLLYKANRTKFLSNFY